MEIYVPQRKYAVKDYVVFQIYHVYNQIQCMIII